MRLVIRAAPRLSHIHRERAADSPALSARLHHPQARSRRAASTDRTSPLRIPGHTATGATEARPVTKGRAFRLLMAGSSVSMLGTRMSNIALPMLVLYLTGSPVAA